MRTVRFAASVMFFALAFSLQPAAPQTDPSWAERLRTEALPAWDAALADRSTVQWTGRVALHFVKATRVFELEYKVNAESALFIEKRDKDEPTEVYGYNPRYTFRLRSNADRGWSLVSVHLGDPSANHAAQNIRKSIEPYANLTGYGFRIPHGLEPLAAYVRGSKTRVLSVAPVTLNGVEAVEVKLEISPTSKKDEIRGITSTHDPSKQWRAIRTVVTGRREFEGGGGEDFEFATDYEYAPGPDNFVINAPELQTFKGADGKSTPVRAERTFEMKRLKTLPDTSEFTLSAFGLPEPVGVEWPARRSGWLWFAWAAAGCTVVAVVFLILRRRAARRQTAAPVIPS